MDVLCAAGLVPSIKYALSLFGFPAGEARPPFLPLQEQAKARIRRAVEENLENG